MGDANKALLAAPLSMFFVWNDATTRFVVRSSLGNAEVTRSDLSFLDYVGREAFAESVAAMDWKSMYPWSESSDSGKR